MKMHFCFIFYGFVMKGPIKNSAMIPNFLIYLERVESKAANDACFPFLMKNSGIKPMQ